MTDDNVFTDLADVNFVEVEIRQDGKVLWVNTERGCILRLCRIGGSIEVKDHRAD